MTDIVSPDIVSPDIVSPELNYLGKPYSEWASEWWKWICGIRPDERHPLNVVDDKEDVTTGEGPVHFLAGTFGQLGEPIRRRCKIPTGGAVFFPVANMISSQQERDDSGMVRGKVVQGPTIESRLLKVARAVIEEIKPLEVIVDSRPIPNLENYRVESSAFDLHLGEDNILRNKEHDYVTGDGQAVTTGYYILLKPLSIGTHEIKIRATGKPSDHGPFDIDVTYTVEVGPEVS